MVGRRAEAFQGTADNLTSHACSSGMANEGHIEASRIFISYSHVQQDWVENALIPVLKTSGVSVSFDRDNFTAGEQLSSEVVREINDATVVLLILSESYFRSAYCQAELSAAFSRRDKDGKVHVVGVLREDCTLPNRFAGQDAELYLDLRAEGDDTNWTRLINRCGGRLDCSPRRWIEAQGDAARFMSRGKSVNLICRSIHARPFFNAISERLRPNYPLSVVDLRAPNASSREGLIELIWHAAFGAAPPRQTRPTSLLVPLQAEIERRGGVWLAIIHGDEIGHRHDTYDLDLYSSLRYLMEREKYPLVFIVQSKVGIAEVLPKSSALSDPDSPPAFQTVRL